MKINFKKCISILAVFSALFFVSCGGEDTKPKALVDVDDDPTTGPVATPSSPDKIDFKYNRITIAGSSITWGKGNMGEGSYVGEVEKYLREEVATTLIPAEGEEIEDSMAYKGKLYKYGAGTEISGTLKGDKISVVFAKERGSAGAKVELWVDGVLQEGVLDTKGEEVKSDEECFTENKKTFDLGRAHTFNHNVTASGSGFVNTGGYHDGTFPFGDDDWAIIRKRAGEEVHHFITFKNTQMADFCVSYDYGENIKPVKSSVDNLGREMGTDLESRYGDNQAGDTTRVKEGLDFRQNDTRAVKTWNLGLGNYGNHNFILKVTEGELLLNFITNHMYFFQNAGIGGAQAKDLLEKTVGNARTTKQITAFKPDLFILESSTNDAANGTNEWIEDRDNREFTSLASNKIKLANTIDSIRVGDVVVMGDYNGDINSVAAGIVSAVNGDELTLTSNVPSDIRNFYKIKRISKWEDNVKAVVSEVKSGILHSVKVGIATCGVPDLTTRKLMGYTEKGKLMAKQNGWMFFDFFQKTLEVESGKDTGKKWSFGDNTHPNDNGNRLFGEAIKEVLSKN